MMIAEPPHKAEIRGLKAEIKTLNSIEDKSRRTISRLEARIARLELVELTEVKREIERLKKEIDEYWKDQAGPSR